MPKRLVPDHNTPPHKGVEKKNKQADQENEQVEGEENEEVAEEEYICDRCTDKVEVLIQCERCEMWLCAGCEKVSPEAINFIGKYCEFCVHWFCKICDKLAMNAVKSYSHMSNPLTKEITSCINDTLVKPFNSVIESISEAVNSMHP